MNHDTWEKTPPKTLEEAVSLARQLRVAADESETRLMRYLRWLEGQPALWKNTAEATFDSFLKSVNICESSRYRDATKAIDVFGVKDVERAGLSGSIVATRVPTEKQPEAMRKLFAIREANGVPASKQNAAGVLSHAHLLPVTSTSRAEQKLSRVAELERANGELRRRVASAEREAASARALAEAYAEQLRAAGIKPRVPSKKKVA